MNKQWQKDVITMLYKKQANKSKLMGQLAEVLDFSKESAYKRFRESDMTPFSVEELMKISDAFDISVGHIVDSNKTYLELVSPNYIEPSEEELKYIKNLIKFLNNVQDYSDSEYVVISNKLPRTLLAGYDYLGRFQLLKWAAQSKVNNDNLQFSNTILPDKWWSLAKVIYSQIKNIKNTTYVFDYRVFENIIADIKYYYSANLLTKGERKLIKEDLLSLLKSLSKTAKKGRWKETSNSVNIYISKTSIEANCSYYYFKEFQACRMQVFGKNEVRTNDPAVINNIREWLEIKKESSALISKTGEKERNAFFDKWQKKIEGL